MSVGSACSSGGSCGGSSNSRRRKSRDMALSVADVYDIAADIGKVLLLGFLSYFWIPILEANHS